MIQSNFRWASLDFPIQSRNELQRGKEIKREGEEASGSWIGFEWWNERLTRKKSVDINEEKVIDVKSSTTYSRPVGLKKKRLDSSKNVRYLYAAGELEGGKRRVIDPIWSLKVYNIDSILVNEGELVLYYLKDRPKRDFVPEELQIVPPGIELPPNVICWFWEKKTNKNEFSNRPKQSWWISSRNDEDMNNEKIVNPANLTEHEDAGTKKYVDKK